MDTTAVYAGIVKHERDENGDLVVYGRATGPDLDLDQQICDPEWLKTAMPEWLRTGGNVREQHSSIAAGVGQELTEKPDGGWDLKALIVDPVSARKVEKGVLRGYSIGIRNPVVVKDARAPKGRICGGQVVETSLVDRPANPTCTLTLAKSATPGMTVKPGDLDTDRMLVKVEELYESPDTVLKVVDARAEETAKRADWLAGDEYASGVVPADAIKRQFSDQERQRLASSGAAMADGSFPIKNAADLKNAIQAIGRAKDPDAVKAHIKARAKALGKESLIPDTWKATTPDQGKAADDGMWVHDPAQLAAIRNGLVAVMKAELDELDDGDHELCDVQDLLLSLSMFLSWWDHEAAGGETTSPYTGDDNTSGGPLMAVNLSAEADAPKSDTETVAKAADGGNVADPAPEPAVEKAVEKAVEPEVAKPADPQDDTAALVKALTEQVEALRGDVQKAATPPAPADVAEKAVDGDDKKEDLTELVKALATEVHALTGQWAQVAAQPVPGGPVLTRTTEVTEKAAANEALLTKAANYDRLAREMSDRELAASYRQLAAEARAEATH